ncbi:lambda exonuclease family protein [Arthrobacter woluwensis]|uniref:YqaJ-like recombinase domain-containing protein n=1 Tax=Arthrobacter woluwensis TaxID=156980 RepID=A0A1H4I5K6_9MICC|nr:lambda exonuclease family protein [Arthrobacter woluwensis]SEB29056.1 YqaJ-like recombinase domain-containing protein [Arthrobacter woluwensis]SEC53720.1 YqaJ-like recombinase domain-containing protein [Arthrobacter woluwensis]
MTLTVYNNLEQGSEEWLQARCGILTASVIGQLITPTSVKVANNDTARALTATLAAERITGYVEPVHVTADMERGTLDEPYARDSYAQWSATTVEQVGFMVLDNWGIRLGFSPDGLVGEDGLIEIKSRRQKKHLQTITNGEVPTENMAQIQTGLLVSRRSWCDYVSFCSGMPLFVKRVYPSEKWFSAIIAAALTFEKNAEALIATYTEATKNMPPTARIDHFADLEI